MAHCATQMFAWVELAWDGSSPIRTKATSGALGMGIGWEVTTREPTDRCGLRGCREGADRLNLSGFCLLYTSPSPRD